MINIQKAIPKDIDEIKKLFFQTFKDISENYSYLLEEKMELFENDPVYIAKNPKNNLVGCIEAECLINHVEIKYSAVENSYQNQGIGSKLLFEATKQIIELEIPTIILEPYNNKARNFYYHLGFEKMSEFKLITGAKELYLELLKKNN